MVEVSNSFRPISADEIDASGFNAVRMANSYAITPSVLDSNPRVITPQNAMSS